MTPAQALHLIVDALFSMDLHYTVTASPFTYGDENITYVTIHGEDEAMDKAWPKLKRLAEDNGFRIEK